MIDNEHVRMFVHIIRSCGKARQWRDYAADACLRASTFSLSIIILSVELYEKERMCVSSR